MSKTNEFNAALLAAQKEIGAVKPGSENPFYNSSYANLAAVMEVVKVPLNNNGIVITQDLDFIVTDSGTVVNILRTTLRHISGESLVSSVAIPEQKDIQKLGGAITYLKRYALQALVFLPTEDDDGNSLVKKPAKPTAVRTKTNVKF
jgi:hypothetical protein